MTARNEVFRDDQEVFVRYLLENPHLVSIDTERKLFLTAYKEPMHSYAIDYTLGLTTVSGRETMLPGTISLIHCNNKNSNNAYYRYVFRALIEFSSLIYYLLVYVSLWTPFTINTSVVRTALLYCRRFVRYGTEIGSPQSGF